MMLAIASAMLISARAIRPDVEGKFALVERAEKLIRVETFRLIGA